MRRIRALPDSNRGTDAKQEMPLRTSDADLRHERKLNPGKAVAQAQLGLKLRPGQEGESSADESNW